MPDLVHSLKEFDLGYLQIVAELWGVELEAPDARTALPLLTEALSDPGLVTEVVDALPERALAALVDLCVEDGLLPWSLFVRRYGSVREMGSGRRDREQPFRSPVSAAEVLWYRSLVARAFFDTPAGPEEFAYIPDDLLPLIRSSAPVRDAQQGLSEQGGAPLGRPARPEERAHPIPASDRILDDACTLLAALRLGMGAADLPAGSLVPWEILKALLTAAGVLGSDDFPDPEKTRDFLEAGRGAALALLAGAWLESERFDDLRLIPHLQAEGEWEHDPLRARQAILGFLGTVPADSWWSLSAFVSGVQREHPDYQRPAGDYDSWFIRDRRTGAYLRGFEAWDAVDGELIRFTLTGPLHWLGIFDLAAHDVEGHVTAFRLSAWGESLLTGATPEGLSDEDQHLHVRSDGQLAVPPLAPRVVRYQIARFCAWEEERAGAFRYRITPASLERARHSGLRVGQLLALLRRHAETVPPNIVQALDRWESHGSEAQLEQVLVLRLRSPELLQTLRNSRAARFLGDPLGPTVVTVKAGAGAKVLAILAEMGYLGEALAE